MLKNGLKSKRKFINRWTDDVYTLPELHKRYLSENTGFTFPQWLDLQMEWNGGELEELRVNTTNASQTTKTLEKLKKESIRLIADFSIVITPEIRRSINNARNECELERIRHTFITTYI